MSDFPSVAVVILNWNGKRYLEQFLPSVCSSSWPNLEIIVGDNASTDDSITFLKENFPSVKIIGNTSNYGFAEGYNRILKQVTADYFVLLNSDVEVTPGWIAPVVELLEADTGSAAAQPAILSWNDKGRFEYAGAAGGFMDKYGYAFCRGRIFDTVEQDTGQYSDSREVFWASGAALFIRSSCWREAGGFDSAFFAHMEEIDLCWRLKIRGYSIFCCPTSRVYHVGGGTLDAENPYKTYLNFRNNLLMIRKNLPVWQARTVILLRFFLDFLALLNFCRQRKWKLAAAVSKAHRHYLWGNFRTGARERDFSHFNSKGLYPRSIIWDYFAEGKRVFSDLFPF